MPFGAFGRGGLVERCRVVDDRSGAWDLFPVFCALFRDQELGAAVEPVERPVGKRAAWPFVNNVIIRYGGGGGAPRTTATAGFVAAPNLPRERHWLLCREANKCNTNDGISKRAGIGNRPRHIAPLGAGRQYRIGVYTSPTLGSEGRSILIRLGISS